MRLFRRILLSALAVMLVVATMTACNSKKSETPSADTDSNSKVSSEVSIEETEAKDFKIMGNVDDKTKEQVENGVRQNPDVKPGAEINITQNTGESIQFEYKNPDGSGGGGAIID